ncbi:Protein phosphatase 1 regulatory subunit 3D [Ceratobasidium sp. 392]|nr:Protein phosphatase 1 regulatory subunit 3D [Ceratobasidium sp. 392]
MMMTASAAAPPARTRRHTRSSTGSTFSFTDERAPGAFSPLTNIPRRTRSSADVSAPPPPAPSARTPSPSRVKKASFTLGSSDEDDEDDCPLVREVNQRARMAKLTDEHFGDFSFDAEAHKAKISKLAEQDEDTETEADFPPTPTGDATPTPKLTILTDIATAPVPFPALSPSPVRSAAPLPPLTIPDSRLTASPVVRSASSPFLSSPVAPKPEHKLVTPASSVSSTSPFNSGTSTPIYLKNGRPLKPSLKSRVSLSMSTPDVSAMLAQAKSAPTTPRVHFPTRERLESVVLFDKRARPLEVASGDSPLASPRSGYFEMDTTPGLRVRSQASFPFPNMSPRGSPFGSSTNLQGLPAAIMAKTKLKIAVSRSAPLHPVPRPEASVHLAAVRLLGTRMSGSVLVKNLSFSKRVSIRYTFDHWETTSEVAGMWSSPNALNDLPSSGSNEVKPFGSEETEQDVARGILVPVADGWDRFVFNIKLDDVAPYLSKRSMFLAVKFEAAGVGEWWDNCGGLNYRFEFDHVPKTEPKSESPAPTIIGRPRSNTSPAPLNTEFNHTDLPSATLISAKLNSMVEQQTPAIDEAKAVRPNLKLQFPSDETITPADITSSLGAELVAPKLVKPAVVAPVEKKAPVTLTPPDSTTSSPREAPAPLPAPVPAPVANLPSPAESPASRKQPNPLPSPSAVEAPAHSTTKVQDQSYADFIAKYCFAGGAAPAPASRPASTGFAAPSTGFGSNNYSSAPISGNSWGSPKPNFGWGASANNAPAHNTWGGVGFSYGRSANSFSGGDL